MKNAPQDHHSNSNFSREHAIRGVGDRYFRARQGVCILALYHTGLSVGDFSQQVKPGAPIRYYGIHVNIIQGGKASSAALRPPRSLKLLPANGSFRCQGPVTHVRRGPPRGKSNNRRKAACEQQVRRLVTRGSADGHRYHNNN